MIVINNLRNDIKQIESRMILPENNAKIQSMLKTVYNTLHKRSIITIGINKGNKIKSAKRWNC